MSLKLSKTNKAALIITLAAFVALSDLLNISTNRHPNARTLTLNGDPEQVKRPIMHTFYEKAHEGADVGEDELLQIWKSEWKRAGFETKILTMKDTRSHKYFTAMEKIIKPILGERYNGLCFYRWLAMATVAEGGWMSDYDVMPTNFPIQDGFILPNGGKLSTQDGFVPALVSGSQDEWLRVTKLLVDAIPRTDEKYGYPTDMRALRELLEEGNHDIAFQYDMRGKFEYTDRRKVDCEVMRSGRAIHLSHSAMGTAKAMGLLRAGHHSINDRAKCVSDFMEDWRDQCQKEELSR